MHLLASQLTGNQRNRTFTHSLVLFFVVPVFFCSVVWSVPLLPLDRSILNGSNGTTTNGTTTMYQIMPGPITSNTSPIYFWCTLPLILSSLAIVPATWYHNTTHLPLLTAMFTSLASVLLPGLSAAHVHGVSMRQYNVLLAMGVGFTCSLLCLTLVAIRHGLRTHMWGGYRTFKAASMIQGAWMNSMKHEGRMIESVKLFAFSF